MRKHGLLHKARIWFCMAALTCMPWPAGAEPPASDRADFQALKVQVERLDQQLARIKGARDLAGRQQAMRAHWSMLQDHLRLVRKFPGMAARGCSDWMMVDPSLMDGGRVDANGGNCPLIGHGPALIEPGMGIVGVRPGALQWSLPTAMSANAYQRQIQGPMQAMRSRMAAIAAEKSPGKRQALMREHYHAIYRDMQTMRGMGWMWASRAAAKLPEAGSQGAQLLSRFCTQCHAAPLPSLHDREAWAGVFVRMREHMADKTTSGADVLAPSASDINSLFKYLSKHADKGNASDHPGTGNTR